MKKRNRRNRIAIVCIVIVIAVGLCLLFYYQSNNKKKPVKNKNTTVEKIQIAPVDYDKVMEMMDANLAYQNSQYNELEIKINEWMSTHTLKEKVAQMFMITPEALGGESAVSEAGTPLKKAIKKYKVGGLIYFSKNIKTPDQVKQMLSTTKKYYEKADMITPFLAIDEEGGTVSRIAANSAFSVKRYHNMKEIGDTGKEENAAEVGTTIAGYLSAYGFNMDMAPDADVLSNPNNRVIGSRSFGSDPEVVARMVIAEANAMKRKGVIPVIKHFPGHGGTEADSHEGYVYTDKTLGQLQKDELVPFAQAIDQGVSVVMAGHISVPNATNDALPSSLSKEMLTNVLREDMGFEGVITTDAMNMGAISKNYAADEAAVKAILAGCDMILMPQDFKKAYNGVIAAVENNEISKERIDQSVRRILKLKYKFIADRR